MTDICLAIKTEELNVMAKEVQVELTDEEFEFATACAKAEGITLEEWLVRETLRTVRALNEGRKLDN